MAVTVLLVDPQPFFCESLSAALEDSADVEVVGWTTDELEAQRLVGETGPDVVLTELELAGGSGLSLSRRLSDRARTVILTRHPEGEILLDAVSAGAMGCLSHEMDIGSLVPHLERAAADEFVIDHGRLHAALRRASAERSQQGAGSPNLGRLTAREREVLGLLAHGLDNQGIARQLHLSAHTARTHVGNILRKLGVHSRADAARVALREGQTEVDTHILRIRGPDLGNE